MQPRRLLLVLLTLGGVGGIAYVIYRFVQYIGIHHHLKGGQLAEFLGILVVAIMVTLYLAHLACHPNLYGVRRGEIIKTRIALGRVYLHNSYAFGATSNGIYALRYTTPIFERNTYWFLLKDARGRKGWVQVWDDDLMRYSVGDYFSLRTF